MLLLSALIGVIAAAALHSFYLLFKSRRDDTSYGPQYVDLQEIISYRSISEFLAQRNRQYVAFVLFRCIPVVIVVLPAAAHVEKNWPESPAAGWTFLASFIVVNVVLSFLPNKKLLPYTSVKLVYWALTAIVALIAFSVVTATKVFDLSVFAISLTDIIANLASALIAALLVVLYLRYTNLAAPRPVASARYEENRAFLLQRRDLINEKFGRTVHAICARFELDFDFVISILIYEDLNRPMPIRRLENLFVRFPGVHLTVGIAQVRSPRPLTDAESIEHMGEVLFSLFQKYAALPNQFDQDHAVLCEYNGSHRYAIEVLEVRNIIAPPGAPLD